MNYLCNYYKPLL